MMNKKQIIFSVIISFFAGQLSAQDAQGEAAAMERLSQMVSEGVWFEDWRKDLNKWSLK